MGLVSYPPVDLIVLHWVMQLSEVILVPNVSSSCVGGAFDALLLHFL